MKMNTTYLALLPAIGLMLLPGAVEAQTTHLVTIGPNPDLDVIHFAPDRLTIVAGDTVKWRTRYGSVPHNITWSAGQFSPAPTSQNLTHFQTFDSVGDFRYRCTIHNKSGTIIVKGKAVPFGINAGLNDVWMNPATPGQGFFINVFPDSGQIFLAWFTYDTTRPPGSVHANLGDPGHRWLTAFGPYTGDHAVLAIEITQGGIFDAASPEPTQHGGGTMTVDMTDCENGTVAYDIDSVNLQGEIPIQRIARDNVPLCQSLAAQLQQSR